MYQKDESVYQKDEQRDPFIHEKNSEKQSKRQKNAKKIFLNAPLGNLRPFIPKIRPTEHGELLKATYLQMP